MHERQACSANGGACRSIERHAERAENACLPPERHAFSAVFAWLYAKPAENAGRPMIGQRAKPAENACRSGQVREQVRGQVESNNRWPLADGMHEPNH